MTQNIYQERFEQYLSQGYSVFEAYETTLELYLDKKPAKCENRHEQFWSADFLWQHHDIYTWNIETINAKLIITEFFSQTICDSHDLILHLFQNNDELINEAIRLSSMISHSNKFDFHKALIKKHLSSTLLKESYDIILKYYSELEEVNKKITEVQSELSIKCPLQLYIYATDLLERQFYDFYNKNGFKNNFINLKYIPIMGVMCSELLSETQDFNSKKYTTPDSMKKRIKTYQIQTNNSPKFTVFEHLYNLYAQRYFLQEISDYFSYDNGIKISILQDKLRYQYLNNKTDLNWTETNKKLNALGVYWRNKPALEYPEHIDEPNLVNVCSSSMYMQLIHGVPNELIINGILYDTRQSLREFEAILGDDNNWLQACPVSSIQNRFKNIGLLISAWESQKTDHPKDLLLINPIFQIGNYCIYQPMLLQQMYRRTILTNRLKLLFNTHNDRRTQAEGVENNIAYFFQKREFTTIVGWTPDSNKYPDAGEIDVLAYQDNILFVIEAKSSYIRDTVAESHKHMINTQMKAGRQLKRKAKAIREELQNNPELCHKLSITDNQTNIKIIPLIIDTSLENDHQEFYGTLKISVEELMLAINDEKDLLNVQFLKKNQNITKTSSLYPNDSFSASRFIEVIRNNEVWNGMLDQNFNLY